MLVVEGEADLLNMALPVALVELAVVETERVTKTVKMQLQILAGAEVVVLILQDQVVLEDQETHQAHPQVKEMMVVQVVHLQELLEVEVVLEKLEILMD